MIGHNAVVNVHREERQRQSKEIYKKRRNQHITINRYVAPHGRPKPMLFRREGFFGGPLIKFKLWLTNNGHAITKRFEFLATHVNAGL